MELNRNMLWQNHDKLLCLRFLTYAELLSTLALSDAKVIVRTFESRITPLLNESYLSLCQVKYAIKRFKAFQEILYAFRHMLNLDEAEASEYYLLSDEYTRIKNDTKSEWWLADVGYSVEVKIKDNINPIIILHDLNIFKREGTVHNNFIGQLEQYINILTDDVMPVLNKMVTEHCPADKAKAKIYRVGAEAVSIHQLCATDIQYLRSIVNVLVDTVSYDPCINDYELDRKRVMAANEMECEMYEEEASGEKSEPETKDSEDEEEDTDDSEEKSESETLVPQARYIAYQPVCAAVRQCGSYPDGWEIVDIDERQFGYITSVNSEFHTASVQWYKEGARCITSIPLDMIIKADTGAFMDSHVDLYEMAMDIIANSMEQRRLSLPHLMETMKDRIQDESR